MLLKNKNTNFLISIIGVVVGGIIRILYCIKYPVPVRDSFSYLEFINEWNISGVFPTNKSYPPLSLYLFKLPSTVFKIDIIKGSIILNIVLSLTTIAILPFIFEKLKPKLLVLLVVMIFATHPTLVHYSCQMLRENSYLLFCLLSIINIIRYIQSPKYLNVGMGAICATLAYMCRYEALEISIIWVFVIIFGYKANSIFKRVLGVLSFAICSITSLIIVAYLTNVPLRHFLSIGKTFNALIT